MHNILIDPSSSWIWLYKAYQFSLEIVYDVIGLSMGDPKDSDVFQQKQRLRKVGQEHIYMHYKMLRENKNDLIYGRKIYCMSSNEERKGE